MADKLVMLLWGTDPDRLPLCATPFFHAAAAAVMDVEVEVYFTGRAVRLLAKGVADRIYASNKNEKTVYRFMHRAAALGAKFYACGGALEANGVAKQALIPECAGIAGGAAYMARVLDDEWKSVTY